MRYGIISDIHSNLEALETALDFLADADAIICLGDVVGYGADVNECCSLIQSRAIVTLLGNHAAAAVGRISPCWFNPFAREAIEWTADQLAPDNRYFLENFPLVYRSDSFVLVHGSLSCPERFSYIASPAETLPTFAEMPPNTVCFIGHTHIQELYLYRSLGCEVQRATVEPGEPVCLEPDFFYIVNPGSVGQPRDRDARAAVASFDDEARVLTFYRLEYPFARTQSKMRSVGLPEMLSLRLELGI